MSDNPTTIEVNGTLVRPEGVFLDGKLITLHHIVGEDGLSYKERNLQIKHNIERFALVEGEHSGLRLYVALQGRDCDGTPLYWLTADKYVFEYTNDQLSSRFDTDHVTRLMLRNVAHKMVGGYTESSLKVIRSGSDLIAELYDDGWTDENGQWILGD